MAWSLREMLGLKYTPACITVVNAEGAGRMLMQNSASMALYGEHSCTCALPSRLYGERSRSLC